MFSCKTPNIKVCKSSFRLALTSANSPDFSFDKTAFNYADYLNISYFHLLPFSTHHTAIKHALQYPESVSNN
jgi:hypothetical protein